MVKKFQWLKLLSWFDIINPYFPVCMYVLILIEFCILISLKVKEHVSMLHQQLKADVPSRLKARTKISPDEYDKTMKLVEDTHKLAPYQPIGTVKNLFPATWYLDTVDEKYRRKYLKTPL